MTERENTVEIFSKSGSSHAIAYETELNIQVLRNRFEGVDGYIKVTIVYVEDEVEDDK